MSQMFVCVYMNGILYELTSSGVCCPINGLFAGTFGYVGRLKLLTQYIDLLRPISTKRC